MALNYQQLNQQIQQLGESALKNASVLAEQRQRAGDLLCSTEIDLEQLRHKVESIVADHDPYLRCALPVPLADGGYAPLATPFPLPPLPEKAAILAADGSQIFPDRHESVYFGLVNVGAIQMRLGAPDPPSVETTSQLIYDEDLWDLNDATLALRRDHSERAILAELAFHAPPPVITFTDGPMELWGVKDSDRSDVYQKSLKNYIAVLRQLEEQGVVTAGYVDRPAANLVVRLLEIALLPLDRLGEIKKYHPLRGVQDIALYGELLPPGERSVVFAIQSPSAKNYSGGLALHFFYLNVGREGHPWLARVEIPAWVAQNEERLNDLHAVLVNQCSIMGLRAYPYLLHRSHEAAVVTWEEKQQVVEMITQELVQRGIPLGVKSHKQAAKNLPGRARHGRR